MHRHTGDPSISVDIRHRSLRLTLLTSLAVLTASLGAVAPAGAAAGKQDRGTSVEPGPLPGGGYVSARHTSSAAAELVTFVQRRVSRSGFRVRVDGVFGEETEAAVRRFQAARRLQVDGVVGRQTMSALRRSLENASAAVEGGQSRLESRRTAGRRGGAGASMRDRDRDRLPDRWERRYGLSTRKKSARQDPDRDGLGNRAEFRSHTRPRDADSDNDRVLDADEDRDRDRVDNRSEVRARTHPRRRDSDRDGRPDGREDRDRDRLANAAEDRTGNDPADSDSDEDGVRDGDEGAATVLSFQNGVLTIDRFNGGPLSARVTEDTGLDCVDENDADDSGAPPGDGPDEADEPDDDAGDDDVLDDSPGDDAASDGGDDGEDPCMRALVPRAGIRSAELDDGADSPAWSEVEVVR